MPMDQNPTLNISATASIVEDLYYAFSIRGASVANNRPIWNINVSVDSIAFYIGAIGSVSLGYMLNQYEPRNIDNIAYVNDQGETGSNFFLKVAKSTLFYPLSILQRFVTGGVVYVLIGFATHKFLGGGRPFACGALTGIYFSYGSGSPFTEMLKAVAGFATFSVVMEKLIDMGLNSR